MSTQIIPIEIIENRIFVIRAQKVMIDRDLADLYGVQTKRLNEAVKRNIKRFPEEFMFQLNDEEKKELVANCDRLKNLTYSTSNPYAFTEHGVAMLSAVLNSDQAISVNIQIIKAFVKLRQIAVDYKDVPQRLSEIEKLLMLYIDTNDEKQEQQDSQIMDIIEALNFLIEKPQESRKIGFNTED